jgi:hypothetical protein
MRAALELLLRAAALGLVASQQCQYQGGNHGDDHTISGWAHVTPYVVEQSASVDEFHKTYRLYAKLVGHAKDVFSIIGSKFGHIWIPPAYNLGKPFGVNIGGVNPAYFPYAANGKFDSWLHRRVWLPERRRPRRSRHDRRVGRLGLRQGGRRD